MIPYSDRRGIGISRNFKAIIDRNEVYRRVMILARYLSYTIAKMGLNPTTFYFKIRYEYGLKNSQSITENRLFNERFLIDLAKSILNEKLLKVRDKYGVDVVKYASENSI